MRLRLLRIKEAQEEWVKEPEVVKEMMSEEALADREIFWVLHLNTKLRVIEKEMVAMGTLDTTTIHPREVFRKAVMNSTDRIITVHNHPSGDPTPSGEDKAIWARLSEAGKILGIEVIDNLIIARNGYYSDH